MSLEENKGIIRSLFEAANKRNLTVWDELIAPDYVDHTFQRRGVEDVKQFLIKFFKTFPDWREITEDIIAEGDKSELEYVYEPR